MSGNLVGRTIHNYRFIKSLAVGGMGEVYLAEGLKPVAIKVLKPDYSNQDEYQVRFSREARLISDLNTPVPHDNIVNVIDYFNDDRNCYLVMEYIDGYDFNHLIAENSAINPQVGMAWQQAVGLIIQVLAGLEHSHIKGVVHRDIKPNNLMVNSVGRVKILDFGIARRFDPDSTEITRYYSEEKNQLEKNVFQPGTFNYMAPELLTGSSVGVECDIYSTALVLCKMLLGSLPERQKPDSFSQYDDSPFLNGIAKAFANKPGQYPTELPGLLLQCLQNSPRQRMSATVFRESLERLLKDNENLTGKVIQGYLFIKLMRMGSMGQIYLAEKTPITRIVAIKVIRPAAVDNREFLTRFNRDAQLISNLHNPIPHDNIVNLYDYFIHNNKYFLVMEFVDGYDFNQLIKENPTGMDWRQASQLMVQVFSGLIHAHGKGVLHRGMAPGKLMVNAVGKVKILDFGLAPLLDPEVGDLNNLLRKEKGKTGNVRYLAPKLVESALATTEADVYSANLVLLELLLGNLPSLESLSVALGGKFSDWPDELTQFLKKILDPRQKSRKLSARQMKDALENILASNPGNTPLATANMGMAFSSIEPSLIQKKWLLGLLIITLLLVIGLARVEVIDNPFLVEQATVSSRLQQTEVKPENLPKPEVANPRPPLPDALKTLLNQADELRGQAKTNTFERVGQLLADAKTVLDEESTKLVAGGFLPTEKNLDLLGYSHLPAYLRANYRYRRAKTIYEALTADYDYAQTSLTAGRKALDSGDYTKAMELLQESVRYFGVLLAKDYQLDKPNERERQFIREIFRLGWGKECKSQFHWVYNSTDETLRLDMPNAVTEKVLGAQLDENNNRSIAVLDIDSNIWLYSYDKAMELLTVSTFINQQLKQKTYYRCD